MNTARLTPKAVEYCKTQRLPIKDRFVFAWTYEYRNFKNEATSVAEGSHGRLKKILIGSQNGVILIQEAIHEYTNRDLVKIRKCMQFSVHQFTMEHVKEKLLLRGIVHKVSRWAINHMIKQLKLYKAYDDENTVFVCNDMIGIGLPCRLKMGRYFEVIDINDIHPFWKQLNFTPSTPIVDGPSFLDSELCARIAESCDTSNGLKKQILMHNLEEALRPCLREVDVPIKQKGAGRPTTDKSMTIQRKELKEYLSNKSEKSSHMYTEAEFEDEPQSLKRGRPSNNQSGQTARKVKPKVSTEPSQVSQSEVVEEVVLVETQNNSMVFDQMSKLQPTKIVTIKEKKGTLRCPRDLQGRPNRSTYTIYEEYLEQLPPIIVPFVLSTDEVDGDGNCGFHVATEQIGYFGEAVKEDVTQCQYLRTKMVIQLIKDKVFYMDMMRRGDRHDKEVEFKDFVARIKCRKGLKTIGSKYWMTMPKCGYLLADAFNCVVHFFVPPMYGHSFTFAPTRTVFDESVKDRRIVIAFVNEMNFIGLRVKREFPLPMLSGWTDYFPTNHCKDWVKQYETNMLDWDRVMKDSFPEGIIELVHPDDEDK